MKAVLPSAPQQGLHSTGAPTTGGDKGPDSSRERAAVRQNVTGVDSH